MEKNICLNEFNWVTRKLDDDDDDDDNYMKKQKENVQVVGKKPIRLV